MAADTLKILLVEDDELDVMNVQRAFRKNDKVHAIHVAGDGVEALEMLQQGEIPLDHLLILLDVNMPRMNGIEFLRELRADPEFKPLPVVMLTTSNDERDKIEAYDLNVAGYILKPVTFERFVECMKLIKLYWTMVELP